MAMRRSTLERRIKEGKKQPKRLHVVPGVTALFIEAPNKDYLSYLNFEDGFNRYLGSLDPIENRKELRQLQRWIDKILRTN